MRLPQSQEAGPGHKEEIESEMIMNTVNINRNQSLQN